MTSPIPVATWRHAQGTATCPARSARLVPFRAPVPYIEMLCLGNLCVATPSISIIGAVMAVGPWDVRDTVHHTNHQVRAPDQRRTPDDHRVDQRPLPACLPRPWPFPYLVTSSLDPSGRGKARWAMRWKPALNAFAITFTAESPRLETNRCQGQIHRKSDTPCEAPISSITLSVA